MQIERNNNDAWIINKHINDVNLLMALNTYNGKLTNEEVAVAHSLEYSDPKSF